LIRTRTTILYIVIAILTTTDTIIVITITTIIVIISFLVSMIPLIRMAHHHPFLLQSDVGILAIIIIIIRNDVFGCYFAHLTIVR